MKSHGDIFEKIISPDNLFSAWDEFYKDKKKKEDVQHFEFELEQHVFQLHRDLKSQKYKHGPYSDFYICDPKVRHIYKASVRDRVLHHAIFKVLNPIFEPTFIQNSFSCRTHKGNHKGVLALETMIRKASKNYSESCFVLKCDVKKFFDTVDHEVLLSILRKRIKDCDVMWLLEEIVGSYASSRSTLFEHKGVPIGNLTSQLFANVYMNELDQFVKHDLKVKHYARYTDDFVIVSTDKKYLEDLLDPFRKFIGDKLKLSLHPKKCSILNAGQGVDFLGYVILPHYRLLRSKTKRRIF